MSKRPLSILAAEAERKRLETVAADAHRIASALGIEVPEEIKKLEVADVIDVLARLIEKKLIEQAERALLVRGKR